jgi:hypothetical protein
MPRADSATASVERSRHVGFDLNFGHVFASH